MSETESVTELVQNPIGRSRRLLWWFFGVVAMIIILGVGFLWWLLQAPAGDQGVITVVVEPGQTVSSIADEVATAGIVKSADALYVVLQLRHKDAVIKAGMYELIPANTLQVAKALVNTVPTEELIRLTLPEGMRAQDYATLAAAVLPDFDHVAYATAGREREGYLWPETYFVPPDYTAADLLALQENSIREVLNKYATEFSASSLTEYEVLILASIVEREANTPESMKLVAGILLNRLAIGMALQADASIEYVLDTPLGALPPGVLASELRERESPYNTYLNAGLPPTPIGNPGEQAIAAVLTPTASDYFFYITGDDGNFYYAETFDQHRLNINRHLR